MKLLIGAIMSTALLASACASTFVATKDGKGYYLGNSSNAAYERFCTSGDLQKILAGTQLSQDLKNDLFRYNCGPERSSTKVKQLFASMAPEQRKELRMSFKSNGYDINYIPC